MSPPLEIGVTETPEQLAHRLNLPFKNFSLLRRALTHRSYLNEFDDAIEDNERLEFLGDAVLDYVVSVWLYHAYPEMAEGSLTKIRSAIVGNAQLAEIARTLGIGNALFLGRGEEEGGGRSRTSLLGSTLEAIIAALFIDSGADAVQAFLAPILPGAASRILASQGHRDPKSAFQEWTQAQGLGVPSYHMISQTGPDHDRTYVFEVRVGGMAYGRGEGSTKQDAGKAAARAALDALNLD
jgi:ribonuclease-3